MSEEVSSEVTVNKKYNKPKKPAKIVSDTLIIFLRAVFDNNFKEGNWHLSPKEDMYIRQQYPENVKKVGVKPGIVAGKRGGTQRGINFLGEQNFIPMPRRNLSTFSGSDDAFTGQVSLRAVSPVKDESEDIAYLSMISINKFVEDILGVKGIAHIDAQGYNNAQPFEVSTEHKLWGSEIPIRYAIKIPYATTFTDGARLTGVEQHFNVEMDYENKNKEE